MKRAALKQAPRPLLGPILEMPLGDIVGLDPCNARRLPPTPAETEDLAASIQARGLINPLVLRGQPIRWTVLAGGRRFRALQLCLKASDLVRVRIFEGGDDEAAELSEHENEDREALHPLDRADAIAERAARLGLAEVGRREGRSERWVREQIALSNLPEAARAAWARGKIDLAAAKALTFGEADQIEALLDGPQAAAILSSPKNIRAWIGPKGVLATAPLARFVGLEAYEAAGGALKRDLFSDHAVLFDIDLLNRLASAALSREGERLQEAEGWGHVFFDPGHRCREIKPDLTDEERRRLDEIGGGDSETDEEIEIYRRAILRRVPEAQRAHFGVELGIDPDGRLEVVRGLIVGGSASPAQNPAADEAPSVAAASEGAASHSPAAVPTARMATPAASGLPLVLPEKARRLAEVAGSKALARLLLEDEPGRLDVALALAIAAFAARSTTRTGLGLNFIAGPGGAYGPLARDAARFGFVAALDLCFRQSTDALERAFREMVAGAFDLRRADEDVSAGLMDVFARFAAPRAAAAAEMDYAGFFAEAGRVWSLQAIRDCAGAAAETQRAWMNDEALAGEAALLAKARQWLPPFLAGADR